MTPFVIQKHLAKKAGLHYDFRFVEGEVAPSWAIPKGFSAKSKKSRLAIQTENHPVSWMGFEGEIAAGYGAGTVEIWEKGELEIEERTPDLVRFRVDSGKVAGQWTLKRASIASGSRWVIQPYVPPSGATVESVLPRSGIIAALVETAERLKIAGENQYKAVAYKNAAKAIEELDSFEQYDGNMLLQVSGIGEGIAKASGELRATGTTTLLEELRGKTQLKKRFPHVEAMSVATAIVEALRKQFPDARIDVAGSLRRGKDPKDIDILIAGDDGEVAYSRFCRTLGKNLDLGEKATSIVKEGIQVDLRIVPKAAYGAGLLFFTGSAEFNIKCRVKAKTMGLHLTRYGLTDVAGNIIARDSEKQILDALGISWLEPKDR